MSGVLLAWAVSPRMTGDPGASRRSSRRPSFELDETLDAAARSALPGWFAVNGLLGIRARRMADASHLWAADHRAGMRVLGNGSLSAGVGVHAARRGTRTGDTRTAFEGPSPHVCIRGSSHRGDPGVHRPFDSAGGFRRMTWFRLGRRRYRQYARSRVAGACRTPCGEAPHAPS